MQIIIKRFSLFSAVHRCSADRYTYLHRFIRSRIDLHRLIGTRFPVHKLYHFKVDTILRPVATKVVFVHLEREKQ